MRATPIADSVPVAAAFWEVCTSGPARDPHRVPIPEHAIWRFDRSSQASADGVLPCLGNGSTTLALLPTDPWQPAPFSRVLSIAVRDDE